MPEACSVSFRSKTPERRREKKKTPHRNKKTHLKGLGKTLHFPSSPLNGQDPHHRCNAHFEKCQEAVSNQEGLQHRFLWPRQLVWLGLFLTPCLPWTNLKKKKRLILVILISGNMPVLISPTLHLLFSQKHTNKKTLNQAVCSTLSNLKHFVDRAWQLMDSVKQDSLKIKPTTNTNNPPTTRMYLTC